MGWPGGGQGAGTSLRSSSRPRSQSLQGQRRMDQRQARTAALLAGADRHLAPVLQALSARSSFRRTSLTLADDRGISATPSSVAFWIAQSIRSPRDRPCPRWIRRGESGWPANCSRSSTRTFFLPTLTSSPRYSRPLPSEQLHGVARGVPQHAADVVGLGPGRSCWPRERLVDEEAGQAHGDSRGSGDKRAVYRLPRALEPAPRNEGAATFSPDRGGPGGSR